MSQVEEIDASIYLSNLRGPPTDDGNASEERPKTKAEKKKSSSKDKETKTKTKGTSSVSDKRGNNGKGAAATERATTTAASTAAAAAATSAAEEAKRHCAVEVHEATKDMAMLKQRRKGGMVEPTEFENAKKVRTRRRRRLVLGVETSAPRVR